MSVKRFEMISSPLEKIPNRFRIDVEADGEDLSGILEYFRGKVGTLWTPPHGPFRYAFYFYDSSEKDRETLTGFLSGQDVPTTESFKPELNQEAETIETEMESTRTDAVLTPSDLEKIQKIEIKSEVEEFEVKGENAGREEKSGEGEILKEETGDSDEEILKVEETQPMEMVPSTVRDISLVYFYPKGQEDLAEKVHAALTDTLKKKKMRCSFRKALSISYKLPDLMEIDEAVAKARRMSVDSLIGIGEIQDLQVLAEVCRQNSIFIQMISPKYVDKRFWCLGMAMEIAAR